MHGFTERAYSVKGKYVDWVSVLQNPLKFMDPSAIPTGFIFRKLQELGLPELKILYDHLLIRQDRLIETTDSHTPWLQTGYKFKACSRDLVGDPIAILTVSHHQSPRVAVTEAENKSTTGIPQDIVCLSLISLTMICPSHVSG